MIMNQIKPVSCDPRSEEKFVFSKHERKRWTRRHIGRIVKKKHTSAYSEYRLLSSAPENSQHVILFGANLINYGWLDTRALI